MSARYTYHGYPVADWQVAVFPDGQVLADHEDDDSPLGRLIVRQRTELKVPVPPAIPRQRAA